MALGTVLLSSHVVLSHMYVRKFAASEHSLHFKAPPPPPLLYSRQLPKPCRHSNGKGLCNPAGSFACCLVMP